MQVWRMEWMCCGFEVFAPDYDMNSVDYSGGNKKRWAVSCRTKQDGNWK